MQQIFELIKSHTGHRIQYYAYGHKNNYGIIERCQLYELDTDYFSVKIWLKDGTGLFPTLIFHDQIRECECQKDAFK